MPVPDLLPTISFRQSRAFASLIPELPQGGPHLVQRELGALERGHHRTCRNYPAISPESDASPPGSKIRRGVRPRRPFEVQPNRLVRYVKYLMRFAQGSCGEA
jgi:hypothetical protein